MMFKPQHCGLYFTPDHIAQARRDQDAEPFRSAFLYLLDREQQGAEAAQWYGLRYRFANDDQAGELTIAALERYVSEPVIEDMTYLDTVAQTMMLAQAFEMVREHPAWSPDGQVQWLNLFQDRVSTLSSSPYKDTQVENLWVAALVLMSGILLEREDIFNIGVEVFKRTVDTDISPRGHIAKAVEGKDGGSLYRQMLSVSALVLMAEAATHCGVNLWEYNYRGVSVKTAALYPIYYFYTPEKWTWDEGITLDEAQMLFRRYGGFLEMLNRQTGFRDLKPLLEDLRPIYDAHGGGLTTLTHGIPVAKKRGLFG
ncbi:MAG TPA: alginate lyase family protein [Phototrophicaceae bacterium]|nr:alginate lyase family protein [Phototrophicaceae bacterium]